MGFKEKCRMKGAIMSAENTFIGWRFGLRWVLLTVVGLTIGFPLGFVMAAVVGWIIGVPEGSDSIILKLGLDNAGFEIFLCAVVSLMQWLALRRVVRRTGFWVPASIIGFTISSSIHVVVCNVWGYPDNLDHSLGTAVWAMAFVVGGILAGVLQQRILRHQVCHSAWWTPASAVGWGLSIIGLKIGFGIGLDKIFSTMPSAPRLLMAFVSLMVPLGLASVLLGIVTGGALIWLLRQPMQQTADITTS
jgi:hypothetical protein